MPDTTRDRHPDRARGYWLLPPQPAISHRWTLLRLETRGGATPLRDFNNEADARAFMARCETARDIATQDQRP